MCQAWADVAAVLSTGGSEVSVVVQSCISVPLRLVVTLQWEVLLSPMELSLMSSPC